MRLKKSLLIAVPLFALSLAPPRDAAASGGYIPGSQTTGSTEVSGHRMILSLSDTQTTLWDQISYVGSPESFAWVLPIKGMAEVGVSSDALFNTLEGPTEVIINPPAQSCPPKPPACETGDWEALFGPRPPLSWGGVVIAREVVGPYDTAQLSSQDLSALQGWFTDNGFVIPADVSPILGAYAAEGFNFLAVKLSPDKGVQAMKPLRVTTQGVSPVLPLRMVAAGAGKTVPITLFVLGAGWALPVNFPWFTVPEDKLVWDWDRKESNYQSLRQEGFTGTLNKGWQIEAAQVVEYDFLYTPLCSYLATFGPELSGYAGNEMDAPIVKTCSKDILSLFGGQPSQQRRMTRLHAELSKEALGADLTLAIDPGPAPVLTILNVKESVGEAPACPGDATCTDTDTGTDTDTESSGCDCSAGGASDASAAPFGALLALGWALARRRQKARRAILP